MSGFFSKLFGKKSGSNLEDQIKNIVDQMIEKGGFDLDCQVSSSDEAIIINFKGEDAKILTDKDALVMDAIQTFVKRFVQNKQTEKLEVNIVVDCDGYLEAAAQELKELADRLKDLALEKGQSSYVRALPPRDRKTIHRHLAEDDRVKSQSVGEGFCKKIKITPVGLRDSKGGRNFRRGNVGNTHGTAD